MSCPRLLARTLTVSALALLAVPVVPVAASAETSSEPASTGAYFWRGKLPSTLTLGPATQPNPANGQDTDLDGVARDDLAVAVTTPGQSDKETFLLWDLVDLTEVDTITKFVITLPVSEKGPSQDQAQNTYAYGGFPDLSVCASKGGFGPTDAGAFEVKPEVDTAKCVVAKHDEAKKAYVADITKLTTTWLTGENNGVAVVPATTDIAFQVVLATPDKHTAAITYDKGAEPAVDEGETVTETPLGIDTGVASDPGLDSGGFDTGGGGDTGVAFDPGTVDAPVTVDEAPAGDAPVTAAGLEQPTSVATRQVASSTVPGGPPLGFWLLALLGGGLLLLISVVTGAEPQVQARRDGRVLQQVARASARGAA